MDKQLTSKTVFERERVIIVSPSLDTTKNVSGISAITSFIIQNNTKVDYIHFELGRRDNELKGVFRLIPIARCFCKWKRLLDNEPNSIIHYNFPLSTASILRDSLFIWESRRRRRKMVVHIHGGVFLTDYNKAPLFIRWILRNIFAWDIPFIMLGAGEKNMVETTFTTKFVYSLPNCVDMTYASKFHRETNKEKPLVLGYLGRIAETKGMEYLLQACIALKQQGVPFLVKIAGAEEVSGSFLPRFQQLGECFLYCGVVSGESKDKFLQSLDVFILPSFFEGLPMSLLECMSYGVVPIVTCVGSIAELVVDGQNGIFIEDHDWDSIRCTVEKLDEDRTLLKKLGKQAKETISEKFSPKRYVDQLNMIYAACRK